MRTRGFSAPSSRLELQDREGGLAGRSSARSGLVLGLCLVVLAAACSGSGSPDEAESRPVVTPLVTAAPSTGEDPTTTTEVTTTIGVATTTTVVSTTVTTAAPATTVTTTTTPSGTTESVGIAGFAFSPMNITISVGDTVRWANSDDTPHKVGSAGGSSWTATLGNGDAGTRTFDSPGTFDYRCLIHPGMTGTVTVNP